MSKPIKKIIVFGGSAGSVILFYEMLKLIPYDFNIPLIAVLHRPTEKKSDMREVFQSACKIPVVEPVQPTTIENGKIYLAPPGLHLLINQDKQITTDDSPLIQYARPSVDVLFCSAAEAFKTKLTGIIVTGTNRDGAMGMHAIRENGGVTVVQDPKDAKMSRMPEAAMETIPVDYVLTANQIYEFVIDQGKRG
jgi:two-component system, chemotaxis family, protein-glutamate methylesterase/glutaminase